MAEDVDLEAIGLDRRLDGYTGADLSSLVLNSFRYAFKEAILNRENHPSQSNGNSGDKDIDVLVHRRHFDAAVSVSKPSVSKKVHLLMMLLNYSQVVFKFTNFVVLSLTDGSRFFFFAGSRIFRKKTGRIKQ